MAPCFMADTDDVLLGTLVVIGVLTVLLMLLFLLWCIGEFRIPLLRTSSELEDRARYEEHFKMLAVQSLWTRADWEKAFYEFRHKASIAQGGEKPEEGDIIVHPAFSRIHFYFCENISEARLNLNDDNENLLMSSPAAHDFARIPVVSHMKLVLLEDEENVMDDNELYMNFEVSNPDGIKVIDVMNATGAALDRKIYTREGRSMRTGDALQSPPFFEGLSLKEHQGDTLTGGIVSCH